MKIRENCQQAFARSATGIHTEDNENDEDMGIDIE